jgi:hypothetical protein
MLIWSAPFPLVFFCLNICLDADAANWKITSKLQFANEPTLDFDTLESRKPTQILDIPETTEVVEFPVRLDTFHEIFHVLVVYDSPLITYPVVAKQTTLFRVAKFSSVTSLSIFFNSTTPGADKSQVYFLGFKGEFTNVKDISFLLTYLYPYM